MLIKTLIGYALLAVCWPLRALNYVSHPGDLAYMIETHYVCNLLGHVYLKDDEPVKIRTDPGTCYVWCDRCSHKEERPCPTDPS